MLILEDLIKKTAKKQKCQQDAGADCDRDYT
jgi:hypothetical protein